MNFGEIYDHLMAGEEIKRQCWIDKKIKIAGGYPIGVFLLPVQGNRINGQLLPHLVISSTSQTFGAGYNDWEPYTLSNQDLFATDWICAPLEIQNEEPNGEDEDIQEPQDIPENNNIRIEENTETFVIKKPKMVKISEKSNDSNIDPVLNLKQFNQGFFDDLLSIIYTNRINLKNFDQLENIIDDV
jgi:hypothetical protein